MTALVAMPALASLGADPPVPAEELGGKGAGLDRLVRAGFPVPPAVVVTASAYRQVVADPVLAALLAGLASGTRTGSAEEVDRAFLAVPVPTAVVEAVRSAGAVGSGGPVAVRSSATVEDLPGASFAGQYRSWLDVRGPEALLRAVRLTWASLWHPAPCAYRRAWGVAADGIAMPVVVMRMVRARLAGVAFTVDPGGPGDRVRVEAVPGLAEALVSGARTPKVWRLPRSPGPAGVPGAGRAGGQGVPPPVRDAAELALRVERAFGGGQDVEWAWDGRRLWVVQARPITAGAAPPGDGCDTPVDGHELTTAGIAEMLPGVLPPLLWEVNSFLAEEALRAVLGQLRAVPAGWSGPHQLIRRVHGRAALDLDALKATAAGLPGGSADELEQEYFGSAAQAPPAAGHGADRPAGGWWRRLRHQVRAATARRHAQAEAEVVVAAVGELSADPPPLSGRSDRDLLAYRRRLIDLGARAMAVELAVAAGAAAAYHQLELALSRYLGDRAAAAQAQRVTTGAGEPSPVQPAASRSVFAGPSWLESGTAPPGPPGRPETGPGTARRELERRLRENPKWTRVRVLTGQVVDVRMHLLRRLTIEAAGGLRHREQVKAAVLRLGGQVRQVHLELGRRLVARGGLAQASDVDLLRDPELATALAGRPPAPAELARRRRWLRQWQADPPLPVRFTGVPDRRPVAAPAGSQLQGWGASPGRYTGPARVVTDPTTDRFDPDDVLVATATDAGWSPLFLRAGALVVELGGPLSHAAIVARELGVPAVLNLPGATTALAGRVVTVDGDAGTVTIHPGRSQGGERP